MTGPQLQALFDALALDLAAHRTVTALRHRTAARAAWLVAALALGVSAGLGVALLWLSAR